MLQAHSGASETPTQDASAMQTAASSDMSSPTFFPHPFRRCQTATPAPPVISQPQWRPQLTLLARQDTGDEEDDGAAKHDKVGGVVLDHEHQAHQQDEHGEEGLATHRHGVTVIPAPRTHAGITRHAQGEGPK
jgi:hypothetical protein